MWDGLNNSQLKWPVGTSYTITPNTVLVPDLSLRPRHLHTPPALSDLHGQVYPTVVFEVGWAESAQSLHDLAPIYLGAGTGIGCYVAIKIYPRRAAQGQPFALLALLYTRANPNVPVFAISCGTAPVVAHSLPPAIRNVLTGVGFGGPPCNQHGLALYQLQLPVATIFLNAALPPGVMPNQTLSLDLFDLQDRIFD